MSKGHSGFPGNMACPDRPFQGGGDGKVALLKGWEDKRAPLSWSTASHRFCLQHRVCYTLTSRGSFQPKQESWSGSRWRAMVTRPVCKQK